MIFRATELFFLTDFFFSRAGTKELVAKVDYSLGSPWVTVPTTAATYNFLDDTSGKSLVTKQETPAAAPLVPRLHLASASASPRLLKKCRTRKSLQTK